MGKAQPERPGSEELLRFTSDVSFLQVWAQRTEIGAFTDELSVCWADFNTAGGRSLKVVYSIPAAHLVDGHFLL